MEANPAGIGIDLIDLDRFKAALEKEGFREKVFTRIEIEDCEGKPDKLQSYAVRFAVKEAFYKALADPTMNAVLWQQIETQVTEGVPSLRFTGIMAERLSNRTVSISLTHTEHTAAAVVMLLPLYATDSTVNSDQD